MPAAVLYSFPFANPPAEANPPTGEPAHDFLSAACGVWGTTAVADTAAHQDARGPVADPASGGIGSATEETIDSLSPNRAGLGAARSRSALGTPNPVPIPSNSWPRRPVRPRVAAGRCRPATDSALSELGRAAVHPPPPS